MFVFPEAEKLNLNFLFEKSYPNDVLLRSYFEGKTPGISYVNNLLEPTFSIIVSESFHWSFVGGSPTSNQLEAAFKAILPIENYLQIIWSDELGIEKPNLTFNTIVKRVSFDSFNYISKTLSVKPSMQVLKINLELMPQSFRKNFLKYFYGSWQNFISNGFGYMLFCNGELICEAIGIFQDSNRVEIQIETKEKFQRQGFARYLVGILIEDCLANKKIPCWSCDLGNISSLELAKSLGFSNQKNYEILILNSKFGLSKYWKNILDKVDGKNKNINQLTTLLQEQGLDRNDSRWISVTYLNEE